jgi:hypothetical protein
VCDPRAGYWFLSGAMSSTGESLLGADELTTLKNITWWFHNDVVHGSSPQTNQVLNPPGIYLEDRLRRDVTAQFVVANYGCHSAGNLFYDVAKSANLPLLQVAMVEPAAYAQAPQPPVYINWGRHAGLAYGWGDPSTTLILQHVDDIYAIEGQVFPLDASRHLAADPAAVYFDTLWLSPTQLANWGFQPTGDYSLQTSTSSYGDAQDLAEETQGVFAGFWTLTDSPHYANAARFMLYEEGQLCSNRGADSIFTYCGSNYVPAIGSLFQSSFGSTTLASEDGTISEAPNQYWGRLHACAEAATGINSFPEACASFTPAGGSVYTPWANRTATDYWVGPPSPFILQTTAPVAYSVPPDTTITFQISSQAVDGTVPGNITFTTPWLPPGVTVSFSPTTIRTGGTTTVTAYVPPDAPNTTWFIPIVGTSVNSSFTSWLGIVVDYS